jgi:hypothetical protein
MNKKNEEKKLMNLESSIGEALRATRLGTCFDNNLRMLKVKQNSFDLAKLNSEKLLLFVDGFAKFELITSSSNNSTYNSSAFNISAKAEGSILGCKAAVGFTMETANAHAEKTESIKACLSYRYSGQSFQIQKATENTYYSCLLQDCQDALKDIFEAETIDDKLKKYIEFTKIYGHDCVTRLYLGAGSIANIEIETKSSSDSNSSKYGVSAAVSSAWANASTAVNWAKEHKEAGLKGNLKIDSIDYPQNSPTRDWASALINTYAGKGLELLSKDGAFAQLPTPSFEKAPPYPKSEKPEKKELPKGESDLSEKTQEKIMEKENFKGTWKEFVEKQKGELEKIDKSKIVDDAKKAKKNKLELRPKVKQNGNSIRGVQLDAITESDWDLGGYLPIGYELTPWTELFPSLKAVTSYPSTSNIVFAKIMTFYYTRLQYGQYMQFLYDVGDAYDTTMKKMLENDITLYFDLCKSFLNDFYDSAETLVEDDYIKWLQEFKNRLEIISKDKFHRYDIYKAFFDMYETFKECPFGFTCKGFKFLKSYDVRTDEDNIIVAKMNNAIKLSDDLSLNNGDTITLKADNDTYLKRYSRLNGHDALFCYNKNLDDFSYFTMEIVGSNKVRLIAENKNYCKRYYGYDSMSFISMDSQTPDPFSDFTITSKGANKITLQAENDQFLKRYFGYDNKSFIAAYQSIEDEFSIFSVERVKKDSFYETSTTSYRGIPTFEKAIRFYPVISENSGETVIDFVYFNIYENKFENVKNLHFKIKGIESTKEDMEKYYLTLKTNFKNEDFKLNEDKRVTLNFDCHNGKDKIVNTYPRNNFKAFGFDDNFSENKLFGVTPMFRNFDFDIPKKFAE